MLKPPAISCRRNSLPCLLEEATPEVHDLLCPLRSGWHTGTLEGGLREERGCLVLKGGMLRVLRALVTEELRYLWANSNTCGCQGLYRCGELVVFDRILHLGCEVSFDLLSRWLHHGLLPGSRGPLRESFPQLCKLTPVERLAPLLELLGTRERRRLRCCTFFVVRGCFENVRSPHGQ